MKRPVAGLVAIFGFGFLGTAFLFNGRSEAPLEPLVSASSENGATALPANAVVLTIADGAVLKAPFKLSDNPSAAGGIALALPEGAGTKDRSGRVQMMMDAPEAATYHVWVRVLWRDSCGNSISLKVADTAERDIGNDAVYNAWHWVSAGKHTLAKGKNALALLEREDGVALDQVLFTTDARYTPVGMISPAGEARGIRRFADDFSRSPGHGMEGWDLVSGKWNIAFSFDPNRIPNQYALNGEACAPDGSPIPDKAVKASVESGAVQAMALVKAAPWYGCRMSFSFSPTQAGRYGVVLDRSMDAKDALLITFEVGGGKAKLQAEGSGIRDGADLGDALRLNQWHHVEVERWAWIARVLVDGKIVWSSYSAAPRAGAAGLFIASGTAVYDDLQIEEIPWQADDGGELSVPWTIEKDAKWFRGGEGARANAASAAMNEAPARFLIGQSGAISTSLGNIPVEEIVLDGAQQEQIDVSAGGLAPLSDKAPEVTVLRRPLFSEKETAKTVTLTSKSANARIRRVAIRYGEHKPANYVIGPYHFTEAEIEDPSDYLDFTPEEYKQMQQSADFAKLKREPKYKPLVGDWGIAESPWVRERGSWHVHNGVLMGAGTMSLLRHAEENTCDMDIKLRMRMVDPRSVTELELYNSPDPGVRVRFFGDKAAPLPSNAAPASVETKLSGDAFHDVLIRASGNSISVKIDKNEPIEAEFKRGHGSRLLMKIWTGRAEFDDIECIMPRRTESSGVYSFQNRETDWWREGEWVDHGGIACILASSWISLNEPNGVGTIWNKRAFKNDVVVGYDVEENTEWYGWDKYPSHVHHAYENVTTLLAPEKPSPDGKFQGYRLVVNADNHSKSMLYRNETLVAEVSQDRSFPMRFMGGHAPFYPRRNRISLVKQGSTLRGIVNGKEILNFVDPEPIDVSRVGIGGRDTHINFSHIEVRRLDAPAKP